MKAIYLLLFLVLISSNNSSAEKDQTKINPGKKQAASQSDGIIGDWKLSVETYDDNGNKKLDPQERAKAFSNHFFFRFNANGTGLVNFNNTAQGAFKSHYKLSTRKNLQFLTVFLDDDKTDNPDGLNSGYYIISVDKTELVLLAVGLDEKAFWIFNRS